MEATLKLSHLERLQLAYLFLAGFAGCHIPVPELKKGSEDLIGAPWTFFQHHISWVRAFFGGVGGGWGGNLKTLVEFKRLKLPTVRIEVVVLTSWRAWEKYLLPCVLFCPHSFKNDLYFLGVLIAPSLQSHRSRLCLSLPPSVCLLHTKSEYFEWENLHWLPWGLQEGHDAWLVGDPSTRSTACLMHCQQSASVSSAHGYCPCLSTE